MLNRAALLLRYKEAAVSWINEADSSAQAPKVSLEDVNREHIVYLIDPAVADTPDQLRSWIELNFRALFENELNAWYEDDSVWPQDLSMRLFDAWFSVECHTLLMDTLDIPIEDDDFDQ